MDTRISGKTSLLGVIGMPIGHSGSPLMYNFCFDYYGIDAVYLAFECEENQVEDTLAAMRRLHMRGANVTMPCKQAVARSVDRLSPAAGFVGAVNTIVNDNGVLTGHMTDGLGVVGDLRDHGKTVEGKDIVLLGAGGAAGAIMVQCALDQARSVTVFNRSRSGLERAGEIGRKMKAEGISCQLEYHLLEEEEKLNTAIRHSDILINASSVGMRPMSEGQSLIRDMGVFHENLVVYDVIYNPPVTKLMQDALDHGCPPENVIGGKGMLLWQGAAAFRLFTGLEMPVRELREFLAKREQEELPRLKPIFDKQEKKES